MFYFVYVWGKVNYKLRVGTDSQETGIQLYHCFICILKSLGSFNYFTFMPLSTIESCVWKITGCLSV